MNAILDMPALSGLEQLEAIFAGRTGYEGIGKTLDLHAVSVELGFVVFEGSPTKAVYNPIGSVHGGYAATLLDTVMGCAVHSRLKPGQAYTTLELKVAYHRALAEWTANGHHESVAKDELTIVELAAHAHDMQFFHIISTRMCSL